MSEFIQLPHFQSAIYLASKSLYVQLRSKNFNWSELNDKTRNTLRKYVNRMTNRTTPFGVFASFSLVKWENDNSQTVLKEEPFLLHLSPGFDTLLKIYNDFFDLHWMDLNYKPNSSIYTTCNAIRFLQFQQGSDYKRKFIVQQLEKDKPLFHLIKHCKKGFSGIEIINFIKEIYKLPEEFAATFLKEMVSSQILVPEFQPSTTGPDFSHLLAKQVNRKKTYGYNKPLPYSGLPLQLNNRHQFDELPALCKLHIDNKYQEFELYANLEKESTGSPSLRYKQFLEDAIFALTNLAIEEDTSALNSFKIKFIEKFDKQVVPLLQVLDPELGISYAQLTHHLSQDSLIGEINFNNKSKEPIKINWVETQQLLLNKWSSSPGEHINITEADLNQIKKNKQNFPPSFSVIFKIVNEQLIIEQLEGNSATALLGRFTSLNEAIHKHSLEIATLEATSNPEVIFAEIAFICDGHIENVNRRQQIREYEIILNTGSSICPKKQLCLSELMITVQNNEIQLWSPKLKKRIIPRLSSAFNYQRSDMAAFRFLCDLQYQGIQSSFSLNLKSLFPNLRFYPRVVYKNCILALASWVIRSSEIPIDEHLPHIEQYQSFLNFVRIRKIPSLFALISADQYLVFNTEKVEDIILFIRQIKESKEVTVREVLRENAYCGTVVNQLQQTMENQFIASVVSRSSSYPNQYVRPSQNHNIEVKRTFLPGTEWLYYKIYCLPFNSNEILMAFWKVFQKLGKAKLMDQWFFVRYRDPDYHLRIRIHIMPDEIGHISPVITKVLQTMYENGRISKIQIDTYEREVERYHPSMISIMEKNFHDSSFIFISFLRVSIKKTNSLPLYWIALKLAHDTLKFFLNNKVDRLEFIYSVKTSLIKEFGESKQLKIDLNDKKRTLKKEVIELLNNDFFYVQFGLSKYHLNFFKTLKQIKAVINQPDLQLITNLLHMHINRVFTDKQREHELLVYILLEQFEVYSQKVYKIIL